MQTGKNDSRTNRSISNVIASIVNFIVLLPTQFILRYFISKAFGVDYMGLTGLYSSLLNVLSLADLGMGASISYALYRPLAENNMNLINSLMRLYRKIYLGIASIITLFGITLLPFLRGIVGKSYDYGNIYFIFILMLLNSVVTYLFAYNQSLLIADQKNDLILWTGIVSSTLILLLQILLIVLTKSIYLYLVVAIIGQFLYNAIISKYITVTYSLEKNSEKIPKNIIQDLIENTIGNGLSKLSGVIITSSDNIFISIFTGLSSVGRYTNYAIITTVLQRLLMQIFNSLQASIGNYSVSGDKRSGAIIYKKLQLLNYILVLVITCGFTSAVNPFISLWLGQSYLLDPITVLLMGVSFYFMNYQVVSWNFTAAYGLAARMKIIPIVETVTNILASVFFLKVLKMGINGVILGTIFSTVCTVGWQRPYVIFKYGFSANIKLYIKQFLKDLFGFLIAVFGSFYCCTLININNLFFSFVGKGTVGVAFAILTVIILYLRDPDFIYYLSLFKHLIRKVK